MTTATTRKPAYDPHPADGHLSLAVMLTAVRMATAHGDMMRAKDAAEVLAASRQIARRHKALQRLVHALERRCQQRCCRPRPA